MTEVKPLALIVDDEPDLRSLMTLTLSRMGIDTETAEDKRSALALLEQRNFNFCLTDLRLPDGSGLDIVKHIQKYSPQTPVAVITAYASTDTAVEALKSGAFDYIAKPLEVEQLQNVIKTALRLGPQTSQESIADTLVGQSDQIKETRKLIIKLGRTQAPVYIHGETGTGKELIARLIHENSPRAASPFIAVNCGAIPAELMESEFFGHKKGSFTGAINDKQGLFEAAHQGTLFLDEIAELPMMLQVKLLRTIQEKRIRRIGGTDENRVDVRLLSATHKNLDKLIELDQFREDLYYRINVISITAPPLRARKGDITMLAEYFLQKTAKQMGLQARSLSPAACDKLSAYPFPGNVRELENILERTLALTEHEIIDAEDLGLPLKKSLPDKQPSLASLSGSIDQHMANIEKLLIEEALRQSKGNITEAAKTLGTTFRSLRYKIKKLGIGQQS